ASVDSEPGSNSPVKYWPSASSLATARRGRELKKRLVLRLNLASDLCARHLVFKEPPDFRGLDQNIENALLLSSNFRFSGSYDLTAQRRLGGYDWRDRPQGTRPAKG